MAATRAVPGELATSHPLEVVQIDHTKVDVIVTEATSRMGAVRPWLTLAIDVHTRMVVGFYLALHEPSAVSVGVCLLNTAVFPKPEFLEQARGSPTFLGQRWVSLHPSSLTMAPTFGVGPSFAAAVDVASGCRGDRLASHTTEAISSD